MRLEEAIQSSLQHIQELVLFFDENGLIFYANDSANEKLGYGNRINQLDIRRVFPTVFSNDRKVMGTLIESIEDRREAEAYRENRTCFPVTVEFRQYDESFFSCIATDMTNKTYLRRRIEQVQNEAEEAVKVKSEFVANITHELRTPVNGILGNILELKDIIEDPAQLRVISLVERGCADMNAIINNILDFSKLESGKFTIEKREFELRKMMEYVASVHRPKMMEKSLDFSVNIAPDVPERVVGDELRIVQVLNNLLSNACKFTLVGRIAIEVVKVNQLKGRVELFFLVIDTGIGISKENQDKLFQSFSQVDASISRRFGGTGLGLNISKQLVELMDGAIRVESEEGKGSMFSFNIWVDMPEDKQEEVYVPMTSFEPSLADYTGNSNIDRIRQYGTEENLTELERNLNKLILSAEMDNWEKAEKFAVTLRELTANAPKEIKSLALRMKMSVQKEDYDKTADAITSIRSIIRES